MKTRPRLKWAVALGAVVVALAVGLFMVPSKAGALDLFDRGSLVSVTPLGSSRVLLGWSKGYVSSCMLASTGIVGCITGKVD